MGKFAKVLEYIQDESFNLFHLNRTWKRIGFFGGGTILITLLLSYFPGYLLSTMVHDQVAAKPEGFFNVIARTAQLAPPVIFFMFLIAALIMFTVWRKNIKKSENADTRDDKYLVASSGGHWQTRKEQRNAYNMVHKDKFDAEDGLPLCQNTLGEYVCLPHEPGRVKGTGKRQDTAPNWNVWLCGSSGMGKSKFLIINWLYTLIEKGGPIFLTDPKMELYDESIAYAIANGYNFYVFNIKGNEFDHSSGWDCMKTIRESDNKYDTAQEFATVILDNLMEGGKGFWEQSEYNLVTFLILYVGASKDFQPYIPNAADKKKELEAEYGDNLDIQHGFVRNQDEEIKRKFRTLEQVYIQLTLLELQTFADIIEGLSEDDPAKQAGTIFIKNKQAEQIRPSLATTLQKLQNPAVKKILSTDEIDFKELMKGKNIVYVANSDQGTTYKFIIAMFMNFAFSDIIRYADENGGELDKPAWMILEEMKSVGNLPQLGTKLSTNRSRKLNVLLCNQGITQLQSLYSSAGAKKEHEEILQNCAVKIFMGGDEPDTNRRFSQDYFGKGKVRQVTSGAEESIFNKLHLHFTKDKRVTEKSEYLMDSSELAHFDKKKILVHINSVPGTLYLRKIFYRDLTGYGAEIYFKGEKRTPTGKDYYPVWKQREDYFNYKGKNPDFTLDTSKFRPRLFKADIKDLDKPEELDIRLRKRRSFLGNIFAIFGEKEDEHQIVYDTTIDEPVDSFEDLEGIPLDIEAMKEDLAAVDVDFEDVDMETGEIKENPAVTVHSDVPLDMPSGNTNVSYVTTDKEDEEPYMESSEFDFGDSKAAKEAPKVAPKETPKPQKPKEEVNDIPDFDFGEEKFEDEIEEPEPPRQEPDLFDDDTLEEETDFDAMFKN